jgi:hypothetical protein
MDVGRTRSRDVVGTFLETVRSGYPTANEGGLQSQSPRGTPLDPQSATGDSLRASSGEHEELGSEGDAAPASGMSGMQLVLGHLAGPGTAPLTELASDIGMPLIEVAGLLSKLSSTGLVSIEGDPGHETVSLTDAGRTIAELA